MFRLWDPNVQPAISDQWNLTIQHQFGANTTLQIGYVGQRGRAPDGAVLTMRSFSSRAQQRLRKPPCTAPSLYLAANPPVCQLSRRHVSGTQSNGTMTYNALQAVLQKHMSHGLQYQVSYTYSKCMSNNTGYYGSWGAQATTGQPYWQNIYDPKAEWAPCFYDATNVLSAFADLRVAIWAWQNLW